MLSFIFILIKVINITFGVHNYNNNRLYTVKLKLYMAFLNVFNSNNNYAPRPIIKYNTTRQSRRSSNTREACERTVLFLSLVAGSFMVQNCTQFLTRTTHFQVSFSSSIQEYEENIERPQRAAAAAALWQRSGTRKQRTRW